MLNLSIPPWSVFVVDGAKPGTFCLVVILVSNEIDSLAKWISTDTDARTFSI